MEGDGLGLDLTILYIDFVATQNNRNVWTNPLQISVPIWNTLIGNATGDIEHDNTTLPTNVVSIAKPTEFLLAGRVPNVIANRTTVGVENNRIDLYTDCCVILALELASAMTFDECGLSGTTVSY